MLGLFERPFILDIDLDTFNTQRAVAPDDATVFHDVVRRAVGVTIAREPSCVVKCEIEGENFSADWLQARVLEHIKLAMC